MGYTKTNTDKSYLAQDMQSNTQTSIFQFKQFGFSKQFQKQRSLI